METCEAEELDQDQDDHELQNDETQSWIGVIHIPVLEYYNARGSKACSVLERVCALLLHIFALFVLSKVNFYTSLEYLAPRWEGWVGGQSPLMWYPPPPPPSTRNRIGVCYWTLETLACTRP